MLNSKDDGSAAFPSCIIIRKGDMLPNGSIQQEQVQHYFTGMTLRDYFAGIALPTMTEAMFASSRADVAKACYEMGDAMLAERAK